MKFIVFLAIACFFLSRIRRAPNVIEPDLLKAARVWKRMGWLDSGKERK